MKTKLIVKYLISDFNDNPIIKVKEIVAIKKLRNRIIFRLKEKQDDEWIFLDENSCEKEYRQIKIDLTKTILTEVHRDGGVTICGNSKK